MSQVNNEETSSGTSPEDSLTNPEESWLESCLATPLVGLHIEPSFTRAMDYSKVAARVADRINASAEKKKRSVGIKQTNPYSFRLEASGLGIYVDLQPANIIVSYSYTANQEPIPGALPTTVFSDEIQPYSMLTARVLETLGDVVDICSENEPLPVLRVGVMAQADLSYLLAPFGIREFVQRSQALLGLPDTSMRNLQLTTKLPSPDLASEYRCCHHIVSISMQQEFEVSELTPGTKNYVAPANRSESDNFVQVKLDWQSFKQRRVSNRRAFDKEIKALALDSARYFAGFGNGLWCSDS